jgi:hypothetical protein
MAVTMGVTLVVLLVLFFSARRDITICELEIEKGDLFIVAGAIAPSVLGDMRDVVRRERIKHGTIRVLRAKERARLEASDELTKAQIQTLRNVIGQVPLAKLLAGAQGPQRASKKKKRR